MSEKPKKRQKIEVPRQYASDEVEAALKGIQWRIGNPDQISIRDQYARIIRLREQRAQDVVRRKELKRLTMSESAREREIAQKENRLLWSIEQLKKKQAPVVPISTDLSPNDIIK